MAEEIYAEVFGGKFPVCSERQKADIEAGYKKCLEWSSSDEAKAYESRTEECTCDLIARLLHGTATYGDMMTLGVTIAKQIYAEKKMAAELAGIADLFSKVYEQKGEAMPDLFGVMGSKPKKEWVN